jgi:ArsR family transcriptional regulator, arsenate/arsenite/antimonite-responsive transcriptional repressor
MSSNVRRNLRLTNCDSYTMIATITVESHDNATDEPQGLRLFRALADPTRYRIFLALLNGETCNCELTQQLGLTSNLVSHHLRQLREVGLIQEHRDPSDGRWLHISIDPSGLAAARATLLALVDPDRIGTGVPACGFTRKVR